MDEKDYQKHIGQEFLLMYAFDVLFKINGIGG